MAGRLPAARPRRRWPAPSIRLRLAALYGAVFLVTGAVLLTIGYLLVRDGLNDHHQFSDVLRRLGHPLRPDKLLSRALGTPLTPQEVSVAHAVQHQLVASALNQLLLEYLGALLAMTAVSVATGYLLAGRALRPLRSIISTAQRVSGENLGERIDLQGPADELRELADTFDGMLGRLDSAFASQRRFVANASHELRTPLAIMRTEIDVALSDPEASQQELRTMGEGVRETVDSCERLIGSLLLLARSDAATGPSERVDLAALAADCVTDLRARALHTRVEVSVDFEPAWTRGDPALIERLVGNLIDNGIHHNVPGGLLRVSTARRGSSVQLRVANGGKPIPADQVEGLVQPFRRLNRSEGGFGLGLSIVRSVVEAYGGSVNLEAPPSGGLEVTVSLPAEDGSLDLARAAAARRSADPKPSLTKS
jgi:signal transduction histidine kinase